MWRPRAPEPQPSSSPGRGSTARWRPRRFSIYWLLIFVPVSLGAQVQGGMPLLVFLTSCLAIVPLAGLIGRATDSLAIHSGPRIGGLLNATFGNITELILGVLLVAAGEFDVVKASLIGSIIGNLVFVFGAALLAGGMRHKELRFSARNAGVQTVSLMLAVLGLVMPALLVGEESTRPYERLVLSAVVAAVLMTVYVAALLFMQVTHAHLFRGPESHEQAEWSPRRAMLMLAAGAVLVGVESELLVGSLEPTVAALGLSRIFVGLFIVAIIGNAAEHASAVFFALRDKMDVTVEITLGSSTQIALFVAPLLVFVSLFLRRPMDFLFSPLEVVAVGLATVIVGLIARDGRGNWLEGLQLLGAYAILAMSFFFVGPP
jgi:Ca2+:H+ antiporter